MKSYILALGLFLCVHLNAQENVQDYILPSVSNQKYLRSTSATSLSGDLAEYEGLSNWITYTYESVYQEDGTVAYKQIRYDDLLFGAESHAYFMNFSGSTATLKGYSKYETQTDFFVDYVVNENYETLTPQTLYKAPNESYQMLDWTFTDPHTGDMVKATSSYKTATVAGYEKRLLVVEFKSGTSTRREYYMKNFGLIATQENNGLFYVVDMKNFKLFSKSYLDEKKEDGSRTLGWAIIDRFRKIEKDSLATSTPIYNLHNKTFDSLNGLYTHMMLRNPELKNAYQYIICTYLYEASVNMFEGAEKKDKVSSMFTDVMKPISQYYFIRPYAESISKTGLSQYVTNVDGNYYKNYWKMDYFMLKALNSNTDFNKSYIVYLEKPRVDEILKNEANIDNYNKCILYSYVSTYYYNKDDSEKRYFYLVRYVEYFEYLLQTEKDNNIDYMRGVMETLRTLTPGSDEVLVSAVNAVLKLKDYSNAMKIADNGYTKGIGVSLPFGLAFAEAAYKDEVNKEYLRKAMQLLQGKYEQMTLDQINQYLVYCRAMMPEFDCRKAESEASKAAKRDKDQKEKKEKEVKRSSRSGGSKRVNFAIAANPFAGLNIKGSGSIFKYLPVSAELRTGSVIHELRVNSFFGLSVENRFIGGKVISDAPDKNAGWKNIQGRDYSYAIIFVKNDISDYRKTCTSTGVGLQFLYGAFNMDSETAVVTAANKLNYNVLLKPEVTRYEALINLKYALFGWKSHLYGTFFYGFGAGMREIKYNPQTTAFKEDDLKNPEKATFEDRRFIQKNWGGAYFTFRMGFRFGFTIF